MKRILFFLVLAAFVQSGAAAAQPRQEIVEIAREAFIWGYPVVENYAVLHDFALAPASPAFRAPLNAISHARNVATPDDRTIVAPNVDTPYSYAWLDLRAEPVVLTLPPFEANRYVSLQLIDGYTYIIGYVSPRTNGSAGGRFLVAGPGWSGPIPPGITSVFHSPTAIALAHYRTQLLAPGDLTRVHLLQDQFGVETLSAFLGEPSQHPMPVVGPPAPADLRKTPTSMQFFRVLNWMLGFMPPLPGEESLRARFASISIGPGLAFNPDPETEAAIVEGMREGLGMMEARAGQVRSSAELFGSREFLGTDYLTLAVAAMIGIYGNAAEEFLGVGYPADADGHAFDGKYRYTITFDKNGLPDVGAFWSITAYAADRFLYANPIGRYSINSTMVSGLVKNAGGGFTLYVQHERPPPDKEANWLPVPAGPFILTFRTYLPGKDIRSGAWKAPPVMRH